MKKLLPNIIVVFVLVFIAAISVRAYAVFQTQDFCIQANALIEEGGDLIKIEQAANNFQFDKSGNGDTQILYSKFFTLTGVCIITVNNGKPINAKFSEHT